MATIHSPPERDPAEFRKEHVEKYEALKSQWKSVLPEQLKRNRQLSELFLRYVQRRQLSWKRAANDSFCIKNVWHLTILCIVNIALRYRFSYLGLRLVQYPAMYIYSVCLAHTHDLSFLRDLLACAICPSLCV